MSNKDRFQKIRERVGEKMCEIHAKSVKRDRFGLIFNCCYIYFIVALNYT